MRRVVGMVASLAFAACAPRAMSISSEHPANPDAAIGRLAGPPPALRPGVATVEPARAVDHSKMNMPKEIEPKKIEPKTKPVDHSKMDMGDKKAEPKQPTADPKQKPADAKPDPRKPTEPAKPVGPHAGHE